MRKIDLAIYDDFVSPSYLEAIQSACDPASTPWYFQGSQSLSEYDDSLIEDFGFSIGLVPPWKPGDSYSNTNTTSDISYQRYSKGRSHSEV